MGDSIGAPRVDLLDCAAFSFDVDRFMELGGGTGGDVEGLSLSNFTEGEDRDGEEGVIEEDADRRGTVESVEYSSSSSPSPSSSSSSSSLSG